MRITFKYHLLKKKEVAKSKQVKQLEMQLELFNEDELLEQLNQVNTYYFAFCNLLKSKFSSDEQTYKKYFNTVNSLYLNILGSFKRYLTLRLSVDPIAIEELKIKLSDKAIDSETREALQTRIDLYHNTEIQMQVIRDANEKALTKLIIMALCLSVLRTDSKVSSELESILEELEGVIHESNQTSIRSA